MNLIWSAKGRLDVSKDVAIGQLALMISSLLSLDQHDKWKRFGLAFHLGEDPFPGVIQWLRVWHNNNNPKLVLSYYLDWAEPLGCES